MATPLTARIRAEGTAVAEAVDLKAYEATGGYKGLRAALAMGSARVREAVSQAKLRGRGGAGFATGLK
ncbi:MAG TPA: NADH-quinone oxidoreductase subunit H, partial [Rectinemataceae bacterium]|nr:NADH-quinone oxidoreductase subunit H [Rectinemataceae bacterium]